MGFCYYLVVPSLKCVFMYNKNAEQEPEYPMFDEEDLPDVYKDLHKCTISDLGKIINYTRKVPFIEHREEFLVLALEYYNIDFYFVSEDDVFSDEGKQKYKGYRHISKEGKNGFL